VFLISGDDRVGVAADLLGKLAEAQINVMASQAAVAERGRFTMLLWVEPRANKKTARLLGATSARR
jgi:predicted amino acid-binding ACT domain protein